MPCFVLPSFHEGNGSALPRALGLSSWRGWTGDATNTSRANKPVIRTADLEGAIMIGSLFPNPTETQRTQSSRRTQERTSLLRPPRPLRFYPLYLIPILLLTLRTRPIAEV